MSVREASAVFPEMKFLEELGFDRDVARAGKFGRFHERYKRGEFNSSHVSIELYPKWDESTHEGAQALGSEAAAYQLGIPAGDKSGLGVWSAPSTIPRAERVDLRISANYHRPPQPQYDFDNLSRDNLTVPGAVEEIRRYIGKNKELIEAIK